MKKYLLLAVLPVVFAACGLKRQVAVYDTYPVTPGRLEVFQSAQPLPENRVQVGVVTVGEKGATLTKNCTYAACLEAIQEEAKKMGGQFIHIVKLTEPSPWGSTCYNITADIYRYK